MSQAARRSQPVLRRPARGTSRRRLRLESLEPRNLMATLPTGFTETLVATNLSTPTAMAFAPDGRLFVAEKDGDLRVINNSGLLSQPFVHLNVDDNGERGLLGVAFDPNFASNHYVYVYYTATSPAVHNRVSRFTANGDVAVGGSEVVLLDLENLSGATNHNGGAIHFGPDGKLYVAVGENANPSLSQSMTSRFGKILRINSDGSIPTDNPFYNSASGDFRAIYALGLRNPYSFAFQPGTGRMLINDVGQDTYEEVNVGAAGANYGWPTTEGPTNNPSFTAPLFSYLHGNDNDTGCAIVGAAFYNPDTARFPAEYVGNYFFADFCNQWIRRMDPVSGQATLFATDAIASLVDVATAPDGTLYYLTHGQNQVYKVDFNQSAPPAISQPPQSQTVAVGSDVTFSVGVNGTGPFSYQWQRNNSNINGATGATLSLTSVGLGLSGSTYRCIVSNGNGTTTSSAATLTVVNGQGPVPTILTPTVGTLYEGGQTINFSGSATDPDEGALGASHFTWRVDFHHEEHVHPFMANTGGITSGSFSIPTSGETSADVWLRIYLTVVDSTGLSRTVTRDVHPHVAAITITTDPAGLQVMLDGQPVTGPLTVNSVIGVQRTISVADNQSAAGAVWQFQGWSDAGAISHVITPSQNTTYTAQFEPTGGTQAADVNWLQNLYADALLRPAVISELAYWTNLLALGAPAPAVAFGIMNSPERLGRLIGGFYQSYLGRAAEPGGIAFWTNVWQTLRGPEYVQAGLVGSQEFYQRSGGTDELWIRGLYDRLLGRTTITQPEIDYYLDLLGRGATRAGIALGFVLSDEYRLGVIAGWYVSFLRRQPDTGAGAFWLSLIKGGLSQEEALASILASAEYRSRP